jgi:hypothetical protein
MAQRPIFFSSDAAVAAARWWALRAGARRPASLLLSLSSSAYRLDERPFFLLSASCTLEATATRRELMGVRHSLNEPKCRSFVELADGGQRTVFIIA